MKKCLIIAHRGISQFAPENTLPSLNMAIDKSCGGIEFDVQLTKDLVPVIIHDETIDRTSTGKGYVKDYSLKELKNFDFGLWFNPIFKNITLPTLEEFFQVASQKNYKGLINVELKNDLVEYIGIEEKTINLIKLYGFSEQVLISSFNHKSLEIVKKISPQIKIGLLYDKKPLPEIDKLLSLSAYSANIRYVDFSKQLHNKLNQHNIKLFCYTINKQNEIKRLMTDGVDGFFTDNPDYANELSYLYDS
jgi:glycerophosphoryl diester phosphodiesterase